jgi:membrane protease YdiL (CAAX protease family)
VTQAVTRGAVATRAGLAALLVAGVVTLLAVASMRLLPASSRGTGVGLVFLGATYLLVWRRGDRAVERAGLSLGGLVSGRRLTVTPLLSAVGWALAASVVTFVPYFFGWRSLFHPPHAFVFPGARFVVETAATQLVGVALPEEAFYRGYLQSRFTRVFAVAGSRQATWAAVVVTSVIFALGHVATLPYPARLAVFFPSLLFGWLRGRTGGIGASTVFHALCNTWSELLGVGYGLY